MPKRNNEAIKTLVTIAIFSASISGVIALSKAVAPSSDASPVAIDSPESSPVSTSSPESTPLATDSASPTPETIEPTPEITKPSNFKSTNFKATLSDVTVPSMNVRYGGSTSLAPLRSAAVVDQILKAHPKYNLVYIDPPSGETPGSGSGIRMLIKGTISFAMSSRDIMPKEYEKAKQAGFGLKQTQVAIDGIAFYTNTNFPVTSLSKSQIRDIYTGKITNWKQVGGSDLEIRPLSRDPKDGGTPEFMIKNVMEDMPFSENVKPFVKATTPSIHKLWTLPGAIGYATASEVCNQESIQALSIRDGKQPPVSPCLAYQKVNLSAFAQAQYPIHRPLFIIIKLDGGLHQQAGDAYANLLLSDEGQRIVEKAGLAPIRITH